MHWSIWTRSTPHTESQGLGYTGTEVSLWTLVKSNGMLQTAITGSWDGRWLLNSYNAEKWLKNRFIPIMASWQILGCYIPCQSYKYDALSIIDGFVVSQNLPEGPVGPRYCLGMWNPMMLPAPQVCLEQLDPPKSIEDSFVLIMTHRQARGGLYVGPSYC